VPISDSFERIDKVFDINDNARMEKIIKHPHIFVARVINIQPLSQLLEEIAIDYEIKIINNYK